MRLAPSLALSALALLMPAVAQSETPQCSLVLKTSLDMDIDDTGRITVPVTFNGTSERMMVDTGAAQSLITKHTAEELKLDIHPSPNGAFMIGFGGRIENRVVNINEFGFGRARGKNFVFFVLSGGFDSAGLLGADFLYFFDLDFDFAKAKLNLISPDHCPGKVTYWTAQPYGEVPFELDGNHIKVQVQLDGQEATAILDTGAADTVMSLEKAANILDVDASTLEKKRRRSFKSLSLGEVSVLNPAITMVKNAESGVMGHRRSSLHMIIGMTVLRQLHLYISYKEKKIYVTPATQY